MYLIYGAGKIGKEYVETCLKKDIKDLIITDSDMNVIGEKISGIPIVKFTEVDFNKVELIIIATSVQYQSNILKYINSFNYRILTVTYDKTIIISSEDVLYLGGIETKKPINKGIYSNDMLASHFDESSYNDLEKYFYASKHRIINKVVHYTEEYDRFFSKFKGKNMKILEIGVNRGGSLQMWKDYFGEKAEVFGLDIDDECKKLEEDRIHIFIGDQEDKDYLRTLKSQIGKLDIIIDDGGHTMKQQICSFDVLFDALKDNGVYLCEDIHTSYWQEYGGGYGKKDTFMELMKWLADELNEQYFDSKSIDYPYRGKIKSITFCDGMVFVEKKKYGNLSPIMTMGSEEDA